MRTGKPPRHTFKSQCVCWNTVSVFIWQVFDRAASFGWLKEYLVPSVWKCVCVGACVCVCMRACVYVCACVYMDRETPAAVVVLIIWRAGVSWDLEALLRLSMTWKVKTVREASSDSKAGTYSENVEKQP